MKISVLVPNYNGSELLQKNLPRLVKVLENTKGFVFELIVVDDGSEDESVALLSSFSEKVSKDIRYIFIQNPRNRGFSHTVNRGLQAATGEFVVLLNSDVSIKNDFLINAFPHFDDETVFAVGFMDESVEGDNIVYRGRGIGKWNRGFYIHKRGEVNIINTDWVSGGSGIFRKRMLDQLDGFNEIYDPFYWEDIDLSYRARKRGYKLIFEPKSVVVHEHAKGAILSKYSKYDITIISYRNQFLFVWKNASWIQLTAHICWLPYHFTKAILRRDAVFFHGFFQAIIRMSTFRNKV